MFCVRCGKEAKIQNYCDDCFLAKNELFSIENFSLQFCDCGSYYDKKWIASEKGIDEIVVEQIKNKIKTKNRIKNVKIAIKKFGNKYKATVRCSGFISPCKKMKIEEKTILITIKKRKCEICIKRLGKYYEAVLQIRGNDKEKILDEIEKILPDSAISNIEKIKHGYDIFIVHKNDAAKVAKHLRKSFRIKESYKFVGVKKGKRLYRNYYSIR